MPARFICQATTGRKVKTVHLMRHAGRVAEHVYFSVAPTTLTRAYRKGDAWDLTEDETGIRLTRIIRAGTNGKNSG